MRRLCLPSIFCALFLCLCAAPAHAFSWHYLADLSGPGPFDGPELDFRLWCFGGTGKVGKLAGVESECLNKVKEHTWSINMNVAGYFSRKNDLIYPAPAVAERVYLLRVGPSVQRAFRARTVEVSAGVEWDHFLGPGFDSFSRLAVPLLIDVKPFARDLANPDPGWSFGNVFTLRGGVLVIPSAFDATDFGAARGTFHSSSEVLLTFGAVIDLGHRK